MKHYHFFAAVVLACWPFIGCAATASQEDGDSQEDTENGDSVEDAIVGGQVDTVHKSVVYVGADNGGDWCTGVLIGTRTVLTAAHCLQDYNNDWVKEMYVRFSYNGQKFYGTAQHDPEYQKSQNHDVGIIKLYKKISNVTPTPYSKSPAKVGDEITVVAYGQTSPNSDMSKVRLSTKATITKANGKYLSYLNPSSGYTCWGDSGAPDFLTRNGVEVVVGVDSSGPCKPNKSIWDPQVSASSAFIDAASGGNASSY